MATLTGDAGSVKVGSTTLAEVTEWAFDTTANVTTWGSSSSGGYKKRKAGTKDATGSCAGKLDDADSVLAQCDVGDEVTLHLLLKTGKEFTVPAVVTDIGWKCDMDNGEVIGWTMSFGANGAWTPPTFP